MSRFLWGHVSVWLVLYFLAVDQVSLSVTGYLFLAATMCVVPALCVWATVGYLQRRGPRRIFDLRVCGWVRQATCGLCAGLLSLVLACVGVAGAELIRFNMDLIGTGLASMAATGIVLVFCRKLRSGCCVRCDYDLRGSMQFGRCPECALPIA